MDQATFKNNDDTLEDTFKNNDDTLKIMRIRLKIMMIHLKMLFMTE